MKLLKGFLKLFLKLGLVFFALSAIIGFLGDGFEDSDDE